MRVNRTDRLYALVEELRAVAPRPRSARRLAGHFEVSVRTVERDISALQQSGVPIYAEPGRTHPFGHHIGGAAMLRRQKKPHQPIRLGGNCSQLSDHAGCPRAKCRGVG